MTVAREITPIFPISGYCTGIAGTYTVLQSLLQRADIAGSFLVDTSLNYYSRWLASACGEYPERFGRMSGRRTEVRSFGTGMA